MKPTIYLGLGGTGNLAISYAKKLYEEECGKGNLPDSVAFVTVDFQTDMDEDKNLATNISNDFIKIDSTANPREFYRVRREDGGEFTWMFEGNATNIDNRISRGASAVRTTGRLYTEMVINIILNRLGATINRVKFVQTKATNAAEVNIHMVMSIAGGTGAGSFITIANAIRQKYGNAVNLYGYGVTHSIFRAMDISGTRTPNVELNAISSIIDLDYLMTASDSNPINLDMGTQKVTLRDSIFDSFYVIDNTSENGYVLTNITQISEILGTCLYACGAEAGDKVEAVINNVGWRKRFHDVGSKKGWVQGLGACQVVYKGDLLAKTYGLKAAVELIRKMRQEGAEIHQAALNWTEEIGIREDGNEYNLLTDSIYAPATIQKLRQPNLDVKDTDAAIQDLLNKYFVSLVDFPTEEILKNRATSLKKALHDKIETYLKSENGVGNSLKFLGSLKKFCEKYRTEMDEEAKKFNQSKEEKQANFDASAFKKYNDEKHGKLTWNRDQKNQELLDEYVALPAKEILKDLHEAKRREAAREIFIALLAEIDILIQSLKDLDQKLTNLSDDYETELSNVQGETSDALIFEYDLSYNERVNMTIDSNDIVVADFIRSLGKSLTEIGIDTELNEKIKKYTESLPQAKNYREKLITEVIDNLPDKEYEDLKTEIQVKSARWLSVDSRGQRVNSGEQKAVEDALAKNWVVSLYKPKEGYRSRLHDDASLLANLTEKEFLYVNKEVAKQKIIICRIDASIIPYCIGVFDKMAMDRYNTCINQAKGGDSVFNPHFDRHLFERMRSEDFKLKPEMKNEAIFYWVCGHFFGWESIKEEERIMNKDEKGNVLSEGSTELVEHTKYVCCLKRKYMYWDVNAAPGKDRQWKPLENSTRRDTAYNAFKTIVLSEHKENFKELIISTYGKNVQYWEGVIKGVIDAGFEDYINRVVCSDKSSVTYFSRESGEVKQLQEEFQYIKNDLLTALANLK